MPDKDGEGPRTVVEERDALGRLMRVKLGGYGGCLRTFSDEPYQSGRMWPRWCDRQSCRDKTNKKNKALTAKKQFIRSIPR